jgi:hypothetical protein
VADFGYKLEFNGADKLIRTVLEFPKKKQQVFRSVAREVGRVLIPAIRSSIKARLGINRLRDAAKPSRLSKFLTAAGKQSQQYQKKLKKILKPHASTARKASRRAMKVASKYAKKVSKLVRKDADNLMREVFNEFGIKVKRKRKPPVVKAEKPKQVEQAKPEKPKRGRPPKKITVKRRSYSIEQIRNMITTPEERELLRFAITTKNAFGTRNNTVLEVGQTGALARSIGVKIHMAKPRSVAYGADGRVIGGSGINPRGMASGAEWKSAKWKRQSSGRVLCIVGPRSGYKVTAWNPFIKKLVTHDPKQYAWWVEKGHLLKVRGVNTGKRVKPYPFMRPAFAATQGQVRTLVRNKLRDQVAKLLASR